MQETDLPFLLTIKDLVKHFGLSVIWIEREVRKQDTDFPKPLRRTTSNATRRWRRDDILNWIDQGSEKK